ncbi:hypothetical protein [Azospirillum palustre]
MQSNGSFVDILSSHFHLWMRAIPNFKEIPYSLINLTLFYAVCE